MPACTRQPRERISPSIRLFRSLRPFNRAEARLSVEIDNLEDRLTFWTATGRAWPALLGIALLIFAARTSQKPLSVPAIATAWLLFGWAALRCPNGAPLFIIVLMLFLFINVILPAFRLVLKVPPGPARCPMPPERQSRRRC